MVDGLAALLTAVGTEITLIHRSAGTGPVCCRLLAAAVGAEIALVDCSARTSPAGCRSRLFVAAVGTEIALVDRSTRTSPTTCRRSRWSRYSSGGSGSCCLLLHLCRIGGRSCLHKAACALHAHTHCHVCLTGAGCIGTCALQALCNSALYVSFPNGRIRKHRALVPHIDELFAFIVIADARNAD